jgi:two-component system chemotaxis response regulator CheB
VVAPPGFHLKVSDGRLTLDPGPRENSVRPAIDVLFRSLARHFDGRAIGVVLSGLLDDGTAGLAEVKRRGGMALAQDPATAAFPSMPASAAREAPADLVAEPSELAQIVADHVHRLVEKTEGTSLTEEPDTPNEHRAAQASAEEQEGMLTPLSCPACGGSLWEDDPGGTPHFHCRVGHAYSADSLLAGQSEALEEALWGAVAALEEQVDFCRRMSERFKARHLPQVAERYAERANGAKRRADTLRSVVFSLVDAEAQAD